MTEPKFEFIALLPQIIVCLTILVVIVADWFIEDPEAKKNYLGYLAALGLVEALAVLVGSKFGGFQVILGAELHPFYQSFFPDSFSWFFNITLLISGIISIMLSFQYVRDKIDHAAEFYSLLCLATLGAMFITTAKELLTLFLAIELLSISSYVLVALNKDSKQASEASLKYLVFGALSSGFFLYGSSLLFGMSGSIYYSDIHTFFQSYEGSFSLTILISVTLVLAGLGYKISAVPFHMWTPDVYQGAPLPVTAFLSSSSKIAGIVALIRILDMLNSHLTTPIWVLVLTILAVFSMTFGNLVAIAQKDIKRLFAYSSIAQGGYLLVGIIALSEKAALETAMTGLLLYLLVYVFMNLGAFACIIYLSKQVGSTQLTAFSGLGHKAPWFAFVLSCCLVSLTGLPPFAGFTGKFYLFTAVVQAGSQYTWLALFGVLNSVISLYYYMGIVKQLYFGQQDDSVQISPVNPSMMLASILCFVGILLLFVYPAPIIDFATQIVLFQ